MPTSPLPPHQPDRPPQPARQNRRDEIHASDRTAGWREINLREPDPSRQISPEAEHPVERKAGNEPPAHRVIPNHAEFLAAIRDRKFIRIIFHALPHSGTVDRECTPLDYGPDLWNSEPIPLYWIGSDSSNPESAPLGLNASQILNVHVLEKTFDPTKLRAPSRPWFVLRDWGNATALRSEPAWPNPASPTHQPRASSGPAAS